MISRISSPVIVAVFAFLLASACGPTGLLSIDLCVPSDAEDPFEHGYTVRIVALGEGGEHDPIDFRLGDENSFEELGAFPMGARLAFRIQVLDAGGSVIAQEEHHTVTVKEETPLCVCIAGLHEQDLCDGLGCDTREGYCSFRTVGE